MHTLNRIAAIIGLSATALLWTLPALTKGDPQTGAPAATPAQTIDRAAWATKLAELNSADWRTAFSVGDELARLPPDEGYSILQENWEKITKVGSREQILSSWNSARADAPQARRHPRLVDVLDLGMRDRSPEVQRWATNSLRGIAFQDFAEDFPAYKTWYAAAQGKPVLTVISDSVRRFVADLAKAEGKEAKKMAELVRHNSTLIDLPEARQAALESGIVKIIERWIAFSISPQADRASMDLTSDGLRIFTDLRTGEAEVRRIVVPLLDTGIPSRVRSAAVTAIGQKKYPWSVDLVLKVFQESMSETRPGIRPDLWGIASALAALENPKVIPVMIAAIEADNTYDTVYGVGYFGLGRLTGVDYDEAHDGAWWRKWWEKNREKYPAEVRDMAIPQFPKRVAAAGAGDDEDEAQTEDELADVKDVPAQDLRVGGDDKKRYFLIGKVDPKEGPAEPVSLLVVLPGGDGSANFHPFIRRILKNVLPTGWVIAQVVAPKWDDKQFNQIVWPTEKSPYPAARFSTEQFVEEVIADVQARGKVDPKRIFLLGWSSGGPACYATALRPKTPVTGTFVAMSVFKPQQLPAMDNAEGKAFYLLQSPGDKITSFAFAVAANTALEGAGANVHLEKYAGGHGWQGDVWKMIGDGIKWLETPVAGSTIPTVGTTTAGVASVSDPGLEQDRVGVANSKSKWFLMAAPDDPGCRIFSETEDVFAGKRCARLERDTKTARVPFGNVMQEIDAAPYRGKRIRLRAAVRADVDGDGNQAMLWTRVDRPDQGEKSGDGFFDNMHDRPIKSKHWRQYEIVGDVHDDATTINFGLVVVGTGKAWLDDVLLDVVGKDVPTTGVKK
ncbi:MAG TPA: hypothetical protein VGM05_28035 [Planctomycetaceae bacterium]|jgi:predicted esterase